MAILVDLSQVLWANIHALDGSEKTDLDENFLRHFLFNTIRSYNSKYKHEYGQMILCADSRHYWRKDYFPYYKAKRKSSRDKSHLNWDELFGWYEQLKSDIHEVLACPLIEVDRCEADDIIAVLSKIYGRHEKTLIVSSDKDFQQLHTNKVTQFSPKLKKMIPCANPEAYLAEHILRGDAGDGIPNFLSEDAVLVTDGVRQKAVAKKKVVEWLQMTPKEICGGDKEAVNRYVRNMRLIDLDCIPYKYVEAIKKELDNRLKVCDNNTMQGKLMQYFMQHRMRLMLDHIPEFF